MKVTTRQSLASSAALRWMEHYPNTAIDNEYNSMVEIGRRLHALGKDPTPEAVQDVLSKDYPYTFGDQWTSPGPCDSCNQRPDVIVTVGSEDPSFENRVPLLCPACLSRAMQLIADYLPANVFADFLEERGEVRAAAMLREEFPIATGQAEVTSDA